MVRLALDALSTQAVSLELLKALFLESRDRVLVLRVDHEMPTMNHVLVQVRRTAR